MKTRLILLSLVLALTTCQDDVLNSKRNEVSASLTVRYPEQTEATRGAVSLSITRCILEIYCHGELYQERQTIPWPAEGAPVFEDLRLIPGQSYDFVLWADQGTDGSGNDGVQDEIYVTLPGLTAIRRSSSYPWNKAGASPSITDAFYACHHVDNVTSSFSVNVALQRPFAQVNIKTSTAEDAAGITSFTLKFAALPTTFNALTGAAGGSETKEYTYQAGVLDFCNQSEGWITSDFLFVGNEAEKIDLVLKLIRSGVEVTKDLNQISIQRNQKTNVYGAFQ